MATCSSRTAPPPHCPGYRHEPLRAWSEGPGHVSPETGVSATIEDGRVPKETNGPHLHSAGRPNVGRLGDGRGGGPCPVGVHRPCSTSGRPSSCSRNCRPPQPRITVGLIGETNTELHSDALVIDSHYDTAVGPDPCAANSRCFLETRAGATCGANADHLLAACRSVVGSAGLLRAHGPRPAYAYESKYRIRCGEGPQATAT